jgi:hypothetical protein
MRGHESMKMTKLKGIFSMALASAMALSLVTVPAFAEGTSETTSEAATEATARTTVESIPVSKTVAVNSNASIPQETFTFTMTPATTDQIDGEKVGTVSVEPGVALTDNDVTYSFLSTDTANVDQTTGKLTKTGETFNITKTNGVTFGHTGIYRYYIEETVPANPEPYITYSNVKYMVDLYVYNDGTAYVPQEMSVTKITTVAGKETSETVKPKDINFENTINTQNLLISKTVSGEEYTKDEEFDFWIMIPEGGDTITLSPKSTIQAQICDATGTVKSSITLNVKGDQKYATADATGYKYVVDNGNNFKLKSGQYLKVCAPTTMIYFVVEKDYSNEGYTQTYKYTETGYKKTVTATTDETAGVENEAKDVVIKGTVNTSTNQVQFINSRTVKNTNTGISLEVAPYALIVLIAICGGILFAIRKRRVDR